MREIVFDTETTGFHAHAADRITEIGCVEIINLLPTGKTWQSYVNPERGIPEEVVKITGLRTPFFRDKPKFEDVVDGFLDFVGDGRLIAHNASFDRGFINAELKRSGRKPLPHNQFFDTLVLARNMFPGSPNSLNALCKRMQISLESREFHGALLDAQLLAQVYLELSGGRERALDFSFDEETVDEPKDKLLKAKTREQKLSNPITNADREKHQKFLKSLGAAPLWNQYLKD